MAWFFSTPGNVDEDLPDLVKKAWHGVHVRLARCALEKLQKQDGDTGFVPYVDPSDAEPPPRREPIPIVWQGFPAIMELLHGDTEHALAEAEKKGMSDLGSVVRLEDADGNLVDGNVRHRQDEYLEWEAEHDENGKLRAVTFVAEGYDYWEFLFEHDPDRVVDSFQRASRNGKIKASDLSATTDVYAVTSNGSKELFLERGAYNPPS